MRDNERLLSEWIAWADKLVNNPLIGYAVWCNKELTDEYVRLKALSE